MDSMSLKIQSFLRSAGVKTDSSRTSTQLVSYFEQKDGLKMMGFLESEWLHEQIDRDINRGVFAKIRACAGPERRHDFDEDVASTQQ